MSKHHPYFYPIEKNRLTAFQALWDNIKDGVHVQTAFARLKRNLTIAGELSLPQERQVRAWARDVTAGLVVRPSAVGEDLPADFIPTASTVPNAVASVPKKKAVKKAAPIDKSAYEIDRGDIPAEDARTVFNRDDTPIDVLAAGKAMRGEVPKTLSEVIAEANPVESTPAEADLAAKMPQAVATVEEDDPVKEAVDIIVTHYQDRAFAKARRDAAAEAARALRHFADKVEASV
jgi:hypothetical protein